MELQTAIEVVRWTERAERAKVSKGDRYEPRTSAQKLLLAAIKIILFANDAAIICLYVVFIRV